MIKIHLKGDNLKDVKLEVTSTVLRLVSPLYKLDLSLPNKVDERQGVALWDPIDQVLSVTIPTEKSKKF